MTHRKQNLPGKNMENSGLFGLVDGLKGRALCWLVLEGNAQRAHRLVKHLDAGFRTRMC